MHANNVIVFDVNVVAVVAYTLIMNLNIHIFSGNTVSEMCNNDTAYGLQLCMTWLDNIGSALSIVTNRLY